MTLTRALIPAALMLVTSFRAPALADTYALPAVDVWGDGTCWYYGDGAGNDMYHYTGATIGLDWGRFNGVRWAQPAMGAAFNVTDDAGHPIPYRVAVDLSVDHRFLLLTIEPTPRRNPAGDFNGDGQVTEQDIFDFLAAYFAGSTAADMNGDRVLSQQDIFDFLEAWSG